MRFYFLIHILGKTQITASLSQTLGNRQNMKINIENIKSSGNGFTLREVDFE